MATAFTTWAALRTAILDAIANHVAGDPAVGEYSIGNKRMKYRDISQLKELYDNTYEMESIEAGRSRSNRVAFVRNVANR